MDRISKLPLGIIETILCFLPIQEAVRTSILSREWRYRWIKIPKLVFEESMFRTLPIVAERGNIFDRSIKTKEMIKRRRFFYTICQVLLMHEGPLQEFTLDMLHDDFCFDHDECVEIDSMIFHLSRKNTVKKFTLVIDWGSYMLPVSFFSFRQLTDLCLVGCSLNHPPTCNVFGSLTRLSLRYVYISKRTLLHLLSNCPLLKTLALVIDSNYIEYSSDNPTSDDYAIENPTIFNLLECIPVIERLSIPYGIFQLFKSSVRVPRELPKLVHLKYLCMDEVCFTRKYGFATLVLLMKRSPNLETFKIDNVGLEEDASEEDDSSMEDGSVAKDDLFTEDEIRSFTLEDYSDIWFEHMSELHITCFKNWGNELNFVKLVLAKSPMLKKVTILLDYRKIDEDEEFQILKGLLCSPRASRVVEIIV